MNKLHEEIYFKKTDLNDLFYPQDRRLTGLISDQIFVNGLKSLKINLNTQEIQEILSAVPKDSNGKIYYKDFQRQLVKTPFKKQQPTQKFKNFVVEKIACAVNQYIDEIKNNNFTIQDLQKILEKTWLVVSPEEIIQAWDIMPHDKKALKAWADQYSVPIETFELPKVKKTKEQLPDILSRLKNIGLEYGNKFLIEALSSKEVLYKKDFINILYAMCISTIVIF